MNTCNTVLCDLTIQNTTKTNYAKPLLIKIILTLETWLQICVNIIQTLELGTYHFCDWLNEWDSYSCSYHSLTYSLSWARSTLTREKHEKNRSGMFHIHVLVFSRYSCMNVERALCYGYTSRWCEIHFAIMRTTLRALSVQVQ